MAAVPPCCPQLAHTRPCVSGEAGLPLAHLFPGEGRGGFRAVWRPKPVGRQEAAALAGAALIISTEAKVGQSWRVLSPGPQEGFHRMWKSGLMGRPALSWAQAPFPVPLSPLLGQWHRSGRSGRGSACSLPPGRLEGGGGLLLTLALGSRPSASVKGVAVTSTSSAWNQSPSLMTAPGPQGKGPLRRQAGGELGAVGAVAGLGPAGPGNMRGRGPQPQGRGLWSEAERAWSG